MEDGIRGGASEPGIRSQRGKVNFVYILNQGVPYNKFTHPDTTITYLLFFSHYYLVIPHILLQWHQFILV